MNTISVSAKVATSAKPEALFAVLSDSASYPAWSIWDRCEIERSGDPARHGAGEIRLLYTRFSAVREEIVAVDPPRRVEYRLLEGLPVRDYTAQTTITDVGCGRAEIVWSASFRARHPGTGWFWRLFFLLVLKRVAQDLARAGIQ